jgi:hypothetical protein
MQGESTGNTTITIPGLKPNTDYVLSFWMRQGADAQGTFAFDTNDVFDNTCQWVKHGGQPTEWTLFRGIFNTSVVDSEKKQKNPETLTLRIRASNLIGKIYVDAVSLAEVGGGGIEGDPHSWTLEGSNDDQTWSLVDEQKDFDFETRGQRAIFDLKQPQSFSIYKLTVQNRSGDALLFSEFELLSQAADQLLSEKSAATPVLSKGVAPGKSYVFEQQFIAPEKPGNYRIRLAMEKDGDAGSVRFGDSLPEQIITVSE